MTRLQRLALLTGVAVPLASCLNTSEVQNLNPTDFAVVQGTVLTVSGNGVPFASVGIRIPANRAPLSYVLEGTGQADASGDYALALDRVQDVGALPTPDTLTVYVIAAQLLQGQTRLDSAQVTLTFTPVGQQATPHMVDVHTAAP